jgi:nucleolar MIF4G domain-containing protein 1
VIPWFSGFQLNVAFKWGGQLVCRYFEARAEERARPAANLVAVLARLHTCGVFPSRVCYGLLTELSRGLSELDAMLMLGLLRVAGARLRSEDPAGMKDFIVELQGRVAELQRSEGPAAGVAAAGGTSGGKAGAGAAGDGGGSGGGGGLTRRARLMLDMVGVSKLNSVYLPVA